MYSLRMLWRSRASHLPALLAIAASATMVAVQGGRMPGLLRTSSVPVDQSTADVWLGTHNAPGVPQTMPIPEAWMNRALELPEVERAESVLVTFGAFRNLDQ